MQNGYVELMLTLGEPGAIPPLNPPEPALAVGAVVKLPEQALKDTDPPPPFPPTAALPAAPSAVIKREVGKV